MAGLFKGVVSEMLKWRGFWAVRISGLARCFFDRINMIYKMGRVTAEILGAREPVSISFEQASNRLEQASNRFKQPSNRFKELRSGSR
jgi:hypothetical protein